MISAVTLPGRVASFSTEREGRWGRGGKTNKQTTHIEGEEKPYLICFSLAYDVFVSFVSSEHNGQKSITLKTPLKF